MEIFISQSRPRSLDLALALKSFLEKVIPGTECWVSDRDIPKGARSLDEIREHLGKASAGIVCLTSENLDERWILYEAGGLATKPVGPWTFLLDIEHSRVAPPLAQFQHTKAERNDVLAMVKWMRKVMSDTEKTPSEARVGEYFEAFWPDLEHQIAELLARGGLTAPTLEPPEETLALVRQLVENIGNLSFRVEKVEGATQAMARMLAATGSGVGAGMARSGSIRTLSELYNYPGGEVQRFETPLALRTAIGGAPTSEAKAKPPEGSST